MGTLEKQAFIALVVGVLFATGLVFSGMTQPHIVIGFLDLKNWNPTLVVVIASALAVHAPAYAFLKQRKRPFFGQMWDIPAIRKVDWRLILGSALFGIGWGITGYCPGAVLTAFTSAPYELGGVILMIIVGLKVARIANMWEKKK